MDLFMFISITSLKNSLKAARKKARRDVANGVLRYLVGQNPVGGAVSVDTIAVTVKIRHLPDEARDFLFVPVSQYHKGKRKKKDMSKTFRREFAPPGRGVNVRLTLTQKFGDWLTVECSLPKYAHGLNLFGFESQTEICAALDELFADVSDLLGFAVEWRRGKLSRLDVFTNIFLLTNENVEVAAESLRFLKIPYRRLLPRLDDYKNTVVWRNTGETKLKHRIVAYDKSTELRAAGFDAPPGIMRLESQYRDKSFIRGFDIEAMLELENLEQLFHAHLPE
jgi:hypothetical protein